MTKRLNCMKVKNNKTDNNKKNPLRNLFFFFKNLPQNSEYVRTQIKKTHLY